MEGHCESLQGKIMSKKSLKPAIHQRTKTNQLWNQQCHIFLTQAPGHGRNHTSRWGWTQQKIWWGDISDPGYQKEKIELYTYIKSLMYACQGSKI